MYTSLQSVSKQNDLVLMKPKDSEVSVSGEGSSELQLLQMSPWERVSRRNAGSELQWTKAPYRC